MDLSVGADVYLAAVEAYPAHRATLNHRKRKVAEHRLQQHYGLDWGTLETLSGVPDKAVPCMGVVLLLLFLKLLLLRWRKKKFAHPTASHYAARCSAAYNKVAERVYKVYSRRKRVLDREVFRFKLWCLVRYYMLYGKLYRASRRCKKKAMQIVNHFKRMFVKVTFLVYQSMPPRRSSATVIFLGLFMSGNVELNPGPKEGEYNFTRGHLVSRLYMNCLYAA